MKRIAVLVDFTETCHNACVYGCAIAEKAGAEVVLVHVASSRQELDSAKERLNEFTKTIKTTATLSTYVEAGSFFNVVATAIEKIETNLVVVATHGKIGLKQSLLGSNILKLVQALAVPSVVVQPKSVYTEQTFTKLLFPVAPHEHFEIKYQQIGEIAKLFNSMVHVIAIRKDIRGLSDHNKENLKRTKQYFDENGIAYTEIKQEAEGYSIGYAKQLLNYAHENELGAFCIMAKVSKDNHYFGTVDKENIILNEHNIPVICTNDVAL